MATPEQRRAEYQKQIDNAPKCTKCREPLSGAKIFCGSKNLLLTVTK
jgi:ribosomal protein L34E